MDPTGDSEDLQILPNPPILVSRPSSSGSELSELPDSPGGSGAAEARNGSTTVRDSRDMEELAAAGLVAQAVDQEVLEQEVAVKVLFPTA